MATAKLELTKCELKKHQGIELTFNGALKIQGSYRKGRQGYRISLPNGVLQRDYVKGDILAAIDSALKALEKQ